MYKIYVINMKDSTERAANIREQLDPLNLDWSFFPAVNGHKENHPLFELYDENSSQKYRGKSLSKGQLGCYASHYLLWEKCIELNQPIIVLEDDSLIDKNLFLEFMANIKNLEEKHECVRLFKNKRTTVSHKLDKNLGSLNIHWFDKGHMSTTGYFITPIAARKYLQNSKRWGFAVDIFMDRYWKNDVPVHGIIPPCLTNDCKFDSEIDIDPLQKPKRSRLTALKREIFNLTELISRTKHNLRKKL